MICRSEKFSLVMHEWWSWVRNANFAQDVSVYFTHYSHIGNHLGAVLGQVLRKLNNRGLMNVSIAVHCLRICRRSCHVISMIHKQTDNPLCTQACLNAQPGFAMFAGRPNAKLAGRPEMGKDGRWRLRPPLQDQRPLLHRSPASGRVPS